MSTTAEKRLTRLRDLYFSESKPEDITPTDVALLTYLILRETEDHFITDSQETLAARLGCERGAIKRSLDRLKTLGWITVKEQHEWNPKAHRKTRSMYAPSGLSINMNRLPTAEDRAKRSALSEEARHLAAQHTAIVIQNSNGKYKRLPKNWERHQTAAAQGLIDRVASYDVALYLVNFALKHPSHKKAAVRSLAAIRQRFPKIWADYAQEAAKKKAHPAHPA